MRGIEEKHGTACPKASKSSARCNRSGCSYRGLVYNAALPGNRMERGPRFKSQDEAKTWRVNRLKELSQGVARVKTSTTLEQAWKLWHADAAAGVLRTRSGDTYKPKTLRSYDGTMRSNVLPKYGSQSLSAVTREGLQRLVNAMNRADGKGVRGNSPSSVANTINALRALYRDSGHIVPGSVHPDPTDGLRLPSVKVPAERRVTVAEADTLIDALPEADQRIWAMFFYAGLRSGEAQALQWQDLDLDAQEIHVRRNWDSVAGEVAPKSAAGVRTVPVPTLVKDHLEAHKKGHADAKPDHRVFARPDGRPFVAQSLSTRAKRLWGKCEPPLEPITPHDARHAYAALMLAAGTDMYALSEYMGHSDINITIKRYGYLLAGTRKADAAKLDALLAT